MNDIKEISKQYGFGTPVKQTTDIVEIEQARAMHEVQSMIAIAKKFPRDINQSFANIIKVCQRPALAEEAKYAFPRGGKAVTGPTIKLLKVIAQNWGNLLYGVRELSNANGYSIFQAFAWDLENNIKAVKEFKVEHKRYTRDGIYDLTDPRDIYEIVANNGARRLRACLEDIIAPDVIEAAEAQCEKTLKEGKEPIEERVKKLVIAFGEFGINVAQIEKRLGHKLEAVIEQEIITLRAIYRSLKDGMAKREEFFDFGLSDNDEKKEHANKSESMASRLKDKKKQESEAHEKVTKESEGSAESNAEQGNDEWGKDYDKTKTL